MWWITILIDIVLVIICFIICSRYYAKTYGSHLGVLMLNCLHTHEVLHGKLFGVLPNFSNVSFNIILKGIVTIICILVVHFCDSLWITYLYMPYLLLTYWVYKNRKQHYNSQPSDIQEYIKPALRASLALPIFHTLFLSLLYITYLLY